MAQAGAVEPESSGAPAWPSISAVGISLAYPLSQAAARMNSMLGLQSTASDERGVRLKRIFEVQLETPDGEKQTKYVLAKSVGWGWLSYHAFLIGHRLSGFVPPILGLRDGILYMEWIPQPAVEPDNKRNETFRSVCVLCGGAGSSPEFKPRRPAWI